MTTDLSRIEASTRRAHRQAFPQAMVLQEGKTYSVTQLRQADLVATEPGTHFKLALPAGTWSVMSMSSQLTFTATTQANGRQLLEVTVGDAPMKTQAGEHYWLQMIRTDKIDRRDVSFGVFRDDPDTHQRQLVLGRGSDGTLEVRDSNPSRPRPIVGIPSL